MIEECAQFPNGAHDNQVTQVLIRWHKLPEEQTYTYFYEPGRDQPVLGLSRPLIRRRFLAAIIDSCTTPT